MSEPDPQPAPLMLPEERAAAIVCHLSTAIPLWAFVSNAVIYFLYREKSRAVCFHAGQGIHFQVLLLSVVVARRLSDMLARIAGILLRRVAVYGTAVEIGDAVVTAVFIVYVAFCLVGVIQAWRGRILAYPFVSRRLLRRYLASVRRAS